MSSHRHLHAQDLSRSSNLAIQHANEDLWLSEQYHYCTMDQKIKTSSPLHTVQRSVDEYTSSIMPNKQSAAAGSAYSSHPQDRAFTVFNNLPYELQNMVWTIAASEPRVVEIHMYTKYFRQNGRQKTEPRFISRTLVPALLHTSSNARKTGLRLYERLCFRGQSTGSYVNWAYDYIRFNFLFRDLLIKSPNQDLSEVSRRCQRLIIRDLEFRRWDWSTNWKAVVDVVLLCDMAEPNIPLNAGNLTLVPIDDPNVSGSSAHRHARGQRTEQQLKTLMEIDDLEAFATAVNRRAVPWGRDGYMEGQQWFNRWEDPNMVRSFQRARKEGKKNITAMDAVRSKQEGMTRERKAERKRRETSESQRKYRLAHPEIPWHEHGFSSDCPCVDCTSI